MAEALSQAEIDALMAAHSSGDDSATQSEPEDEISKYDFTCPNKLSKEHVRSLNSIHAKYGTSLSHVLTTMLHTETQVELLAMDQLTYREYCASVSEHTLFLAADLQPFTSIAVFEFNPALVSAFVDLLTGAKSVSPDGASRDITDIDRALMEAAAGFALRKYADAWAGSMSFEPHGISSSTDPIYRDDLLATDAVLVCGYDVKVGACAGTMSICIPSVAIEAIAPAFAEHRKQTTKPICHLKEVDEKLKRSFYRIGVNCRAVLGRTSLSVGEVTDLEVGDLIRLPVRSDGKAELWVENVACFSGFVGQAKNSVAMQISDVLINPAELNCEQLNRGGS